MERRIFLPWTRQRTMTERSSRDTSRLKAHCGHWIPFGRGIHITRDSEAENLGLWTCDSIWIKMEEFLVKGSQTIISSRIRKEPKKIILKSIHAEIRRLHRKTDLSASYYRRNTLYISFQRYENRPHRSVVIMSYACFDCTNHFDTRRQTLVGRGIISISSIEISVKASRVEELDLELHLESLTLALPSRLVFEHIFRTVGWLVNRIMLYSPTLNINVTEKPCFAVETFGIRLHLDGVLESPRDPF
jgi:hypothetical protein